MMRIKTAAAWIQSVVVQTQPYPRRYLLLHSPLKALIRIQFLIATHADERFIQCFTNVNEESLYGLRQRVMYNT